MTGDHIQAASGGGVMLGQSGSRVLWGWGVFIRLGSFLIGQTSILRGQGSF